MARNEEKANSMLSRFLAAKRDEEKKPKERRPFIASECRDLAEADKWRQQILREIGRKVMEIQNPGLGEHRLRDLNDEINKLIREKGHWEVRIVELGGPNYLKSGPQIGGEVAGKDAASDDVAAAATGKGLGYRYFGAAKQLPGVKELFEVPLPPKKKRNRYEMYKRIDADYYGYRDDEDGVLERLEKQAEKVAREKEVREWKRLQAIKAEAKRSVKSGEAAAAETAAAIFHDEMEDDVGQEDSERKGGESGEGRREDGSGIREFVAHVPLPDEKEIEAMVLKKKKQELLSKYASEALVAEEKEAKELLNIKR